MLFELKFLMIRTNVPLQAWEGRAYDYCMENLRNVGFPVDGLAFDPDLVCCIFVSSSFLISYYYFLYLACVCRSSEA